MKIYTKTGDDGRTGHLGGGRVDKDHPQIEACGTVDELNCMLGWAAAIGLAPRHAEIVGRVQHELFALGAQLAGADDMLGQESVQRLEADIDEVDGSLPPLTQFILPGGSPQAAALHLARASCRRAERRVVAFGHASGSAKESVVYLNRLADLLFVLARAACRESGGEEIPWRRPTAAGEES